MPTGCAMPWPLVHEFFVAQPHAGESLTIALDGKTLRGTIPAGRSHGVHVLAAYLTGEGWVSFQAAVGRKQQFGLGPPPHLQKPCSQILGQLTAHCVVVILSKIQQ